MNEDRTLALMGRLNGSKAIITGAGSGIGHAIAIRFAAEGATVALLDLNLATAEATAREITAAGGVAYPLEANVADGDSVRAAVTAAISKLGGVDILVNNAGILDAFATLLEVTEEWWDQVMNVDLKSLFLVTKSVLPTMLEAKQGVIVNTSSVAGLVGGAGGLAYTTAKHGVIGFTRQMTADFGHRGIRTNAICPGAVDTNLTRIALAAGQAPADTISDVPARRQAQPEEIANLALFLASKESDFVHGAANVIDGGWSVL